ncbi:MAG: serine hydrolase [Flavobacteriales bacterium]|jgi:CubicO group peptidase (beta-lactamase class C family)|nr:serine hydrolase [Flavobacteriales bacterium]MBK9073794.1 serine hydrolase [Flavobacteriales bacterium]
MHKNWIVPLIVWCSTGCTHQENKTTTEVGAVSDSLFREVAFHDLPAQWDSVLRRVHVPGMVVGVVRGGELYVLPIGFRDAALSRPMTSTTPFYIASVTKVFTAQAVLQLAELGDLDLDAPVKKYLPRLQLQDTALTRTITVRDLLAHRKGLKHWPITLGEAYTGQMTEDRFYRLLPEATISGDFGYSNLHYTLLGRVIEAVTGTTWKEYLEANVFVPMDMSGTSCKAKVLDGPEAALPAEFVDGALRTTIGRKTDRTFHAAGGMVSTAPDLLKWLRAHIGAKDVASGAPVAHHLAADMRSEQIAIPEDHPFIADQSRTGWGLGWMLREHRGREYVVHNGHFDGWAAHVSYLPADSVGVVVLVNSKNTGMWLTEVVAVQLYDRLLGLEPRNYTDTIPPWIFGPPPDTVAVDTAANLSLAPATYAGRYANDDRGEIEVDVQGDILTMRMGDLLLPLVWPGQDRFVAGGDHEGSFVVRNGVIEAIDLGMPLPDKARFARVR